MLKNPNQKSLIDAFYRSDLTEIIYNLPAVSDKEIFLLVISYLTVQRNKEYKIKLLIVENLLRLKYKYPNTIYVEVEKLFQTIVSINNPEIVNIFLFTLKIIKKDNVVISLYWFYALLEKTIVMQNLHCLDLVLKLVKDNMVEKRQNNEYINYFIILAQMKKTQNEEIICKILHNTTINNDLKSTMNDIDKEALKGIYNQLSMFLTKDKLKSF